MHLSQRRRGLSYRRRPCSRVSYRRSLANTPLRIASRVALPRHRHRFTRCLACRFRWAIHMSNNWLYPTDNIARQAHGYAYTANVDALRQLLEAGMSPDARYDGRTPLQHVCFTGIDDAGDRVGCVKLLIDAGADLEATDNVRYTPLHCAAVTIRPKLLSLLIQAGANLEAQCLGRSRALHLAARLSARRAIDCVELLLAAGADIDARTFSGRRPFDIALEHNSRGAWPLFLRAGAEIPTDNTDPYLVRVRNAGGFKKYAQAHLARVTNTFESTLGLPARPARLVVEFWLHHAGYY